MNRLQITTRIGCKIACVYCPQDKLIKAYRQRDGDLLMSTDDFKKYMESVPPEVEIWFTGMCEPWSNPRCTEMVLYVYEKGHSTCVFTTTIGLKASDIDLLKSVSYGFFRIHLPSDPKQEDIEITDEYLDKLDRILRSRIDASYHCQGKKVNLRVQSLLASHGKTVYFADTHHRSGNVRSRGWLKLPRRHGVIGCKRNLRNNILLPNGDVLLCCQDYGMKHVLGNMNFSSYDSLFQGSEYLALREGQKNGAVDILCRYCEEFCYNVDLSAKVYNFPYLLQKGVCGLKSIRSYKHFRFFMNSVFDKIKSPFRR